MDRSFIKEKKRIVIKLGSSTITHEETGALDLVKLEKLVRLLMNVRLKSIHYHFLLKSMYDIGYLKRGR